jgi:hypothetical protein
MAVIYTKDYMRGRRRREHVAANMLTFNRLGVNLILYDSCVSSLISVIFFERPSPWLILHKCFSYPFTISMSSFSVSPFISSHYLRNLIRIVGMTALSFFSIG